VRKSAVPFFAARRRAELRITHARTLRLCVRERPAAMAGLFFFRSRGARARACSTAHIVGGTVRLGAEEPAAPTVPAAKVKVEDVEHGVAADNKAFDLALKPDAEWQAELRKAMRVDNDATAPVPPAPPMRALSQSAGISRLVGPPGSQFSVEGPAGLPVHITEAEAVERIDPLVKTQIEQAIAAH
jgi:hypothetical protein